MKKCLLLLGFVVMATASNAQVEPDGLKKEGGFFWKYDDASKTATVISSYR